MKIMKKIIMLTFLLLVMSLSVMASPINEDTSVYVEDQLLLNKATDPDFYYLDYGGKDFKLDVQFTAIENATNITINASVVNTSFFDVISYFNITNTLSYNKTLDIELPIDGGNYTLRVDYSENDTIFFSEDFWLYVEDGHYLLRFVDFDMTPSDGRTAYNESISFDVEIENDGVEDITDIDVHFIVPSLGIDELVNHTDFLSSGEEIQVQFDHVFLNQSYGQHEFTILASTVNASKSYSGNITLYLPAKPTITSTPVTEVRVNQSYSYQVVATDSNNDTITYSLSTSPPSDMTINSTTGLITWVPELIDTYSVTVTATDVDGSTNQSFNVQVLPPLMLEIYDLDVKVDDKTDKNLQDGERISKEPAPGSKVTFDIEVKNLFDDNIDLEDVDVKIEIQDIDDGDDLDESKTIGKIRADKKKSTTLDFTIPYTANEGDYDVVITVEGKDENDVEHTLTWNLVLEVDKEKHHVILERFTVSPTTLSCSRTLQVGIGVQNVGSNDEDVSIRIESEELDINSFIEDISLVEDTDDEESEFSHSFMFDVGDVAPGTYPVKVTITYDNEKEMEEQTKEVTVTNCILSRSTNDDVNNDNNAGDDSNVQILQSTQDAEPLDNSEDESPLLMAGLISAVIVALGLVVYLGMFVVMKIL